MSYWNQVFKEKEEEQGDKESFDWYPLRMFGLMLLIALGSFFAGFISVDYSGNKALERDCINNYAPNYADGIVDSRISSMAKFIENCTPVNVEAFKWIDTNNLERGVMLRCGNETYLPLGYSR